MVFIQGVIVWTAHTGTGNMLITGLPYTVSNTANYFPMIQIMSSNLLFDAAYGAPVDWRAATQYDADQFVWHGQPDSDCKYADGQSKLYLPITVQFSGWYLNT